MAEAVTVAVTPEKAVKRAGWGLLAFALATPLLMGVAGFLSAYKVGELTVQVGFAWLGAAVVIDLLKRKRDAVAKANGRITAAMLAFIFALISGFNVYRDTQKIDTAKKELLEQFVASTVKANAPINAELTTSSPVALASPPPQGVAPAAQSLAPTSDADKAVVVLNAMKVRAKQLAEESSVIDRRFNAIDLSSVLVAQNIVTKLEIDASRKKLNSYKGVIAARDAMLQKHFVLTEKIIRDSGMSEREVNSGIAGLNSSKGPISQNYANLTVAQLATVKATEDILNFAQRGLGRITVEDGQAMFQTQPELDEYHRLFQVLTDAITVETTATERVNAQAQKSKQAIADQLK